MTVASKFSIFIWNIFEQFASVFYDIVKVHPFNVLQIINSKKELHCKTAASKCIFVIWSIVVQFTSAAHDTFTGAVLVISAIVKYQ